MTWHMRAACITHDPAWWYPSETGHTTSYTRARRVCSTCPVRTQCLDEAMRNEEGQPRSGMWGGRDPNERAALARKWRAA